MNTALPRLELMSSARSAFAFRDVTYHYGRHLALDGLDVEVRRGETVALLGPNGAGKSTMISLLLGLLKPQSGTVQVLGRDPRVAIRQGRVGAMLQTGSGSGLPPNVGVASTLRLVHSLYPNPARFEDTVHRAGIAHLLGRQTSQLSGGQAQLVRFAVAIAGDPELAFLDEPTAALDVQGQRYFWEIIRQFAREGRTTIIATHHLREADQIADRVVVVNHGRVVADGPAASLKATVAIRRVHFICDCAREEVLDQLEGVTDVKIRGTNIWLDSLDTDATVRALVDRDVPFRNLDVSGADLEEAFVALTQADASRAEGAT